ncbi:MAG: 2,3-bisphosphoglycerate-independent phosphoglycerate mutase [Peptococcaceae bacterium]|jgi:2,3-bisphosphoglycerate-independent phosphoglycerate mutase|nr:2,3-bisphosphoglycerate-independent phosphoglycerate mutase [Peptococcaceae bacterium]MDH7524746.1 2,3-bisphosphoglycerate-independent phosphoglycerate mutase [Peptococcaceae bacterium]
MAYKPAVLIILDGWGVSGKKEGNAVAAARKPCFESLLAQYPNAVLEASGESVGLPEGQMGNSEVGHLNIGAGRIVYQELTRINRAIRTGEFQKNPVLTEAMDKAAQGGKNLHLMGLLSDGGVHSHIDHLFSLLEMAAARGLKKVFVHALLDGRDVPPANAGEYVRALEEKMRELKTGKIATVTGRYYTMDRDKRWDRVEKGYRAMVEGEGLKASMALEAVEKAYEMKLTDEFVKPTVIVDNEGRPVGLVQPQDVMIMFNFRADRARQISYAFTEPGFKAFARSGGFLGLHYVCFTQYDAALEAPVAFPPQNLDNTLGEVVSKAGLRQLRIAETEKYAHVTFFFNGGLEEPYPGEDRVLIDSPKVATYNLQPEMSAPGITGKAVEMIDEQDYDLVVINYANPDMVGHTGQFAAAVKAIETVDRCMKKVIEKVVEKGGACLITADHGNAECMLDTETRQPVTAHTCNLVPVILAGRGTQKMRLRSGSLQDIAPTVLELMDIEKPVEMTGESLIIKD